MRKIYLTGASGICDTPPLSYRERCLRKIVSDWVIGKYNMDDRLLFAMTATCKQAVMGSAGRLVWLTSEILSSELKTFFKRIDWHIFKNASKRNGKCIERFCTVKSRPTATPFSRPIPTPFR